jgi:hypothetical protein
MSDPYYLHRLVWRNDVDGLKTALEQDRGDLEVNKEARKEIFLVIIVLNDVYWLWYAPIFFLQHRVTDVLRLPAFLVEGSICFTNNEDVKYMLFPVARKKLAGISWKRPINLSF